ncbi:MAG: 7TM diverse intracellular signaling domain-containing protein [Arcobacteraceae bacterium]|jgi:signal transduction histidine kinase|nr:7TM diverse intracellular signaling domain-containing protein [Arcobacteraceae bacterium]
MIKSLISIFCIISATFGFDSIEVLNPNITVHKSGYFKTDKDLTPQEAYNYALTNELTKLPPTARSLGYDSNTYWYFFEIDTNNTQNTHYLDLKHTVTEYAWLYTFDINGTMVKNQKSGYALSSEKRSLQTLPVRFELTNSDTKSIYLLKIQSKNTQYVAFAFGDESELNTHWYILYGIIFVTFGVFLGLLLYNLFLMITLKDKTYLFYIMYTSSLMSYILLDSGIVSFFISNTLHNTLAFIKFLEIGSLILFTVAFLRLKQNNYKMYTVLNIVIGLIFIMMVLFMLDIAKSIILSTIYLFSYLLIYIGYTSYKSGNKIALFYLISTIGGLIFINLFFLMPLQVMPLNLFGLNLLNIALVWDMVTLSLALSYRIKLLQEENIKNQRLALIKSKQTSIGELSGNIAHQWRHPLAELSAILMNMHVKLEFAKISKDELIAQIKLSSNIIQHLSSTVDTFQSFFQNKKTDEKFNVGYEIQRCIDFIKDSLSHNDIQLKYSSNTDAYLNGNSNEFSQIIMNIVLNAKDVLIEREIKNGHIHIALKKYLDGFKIEIQDNGGGIDIKPIDSIFDSYITTKQNGTGIGLFIAKTIVEQKFHGTIKAHNQKEGAIFEITFTQKNI